MPRIGLETDSHLGQPGNRGPVAPSRGVLATQPGSCKADSLAEVRSSSVDNPEGPEA